MPALRPWVTILLVTLWTLPLLPVQMLAVAWRWPLARSLPVLYHRGLCRLMRIRVEVRGNIAPAPPVLYVGNHVSWIDIPVLSSVLPASFVAKHEIAGWPILGLFARLQRSVFIERKARRTADHRDSMAERLADGDNLILFPEGTSGDGIRVLPFKSAFFSLAEQRVNGRPLTVQPVSLAFTRLNNLPVGRRSMPVYAWVGEQDLAPHLWQFLSAGRSVVTLIFHPPVSIDQFPSRKALAEHCRTVIRQGVNDALTGRETPLAGRPAAMPPPVNPAAIAPGNP